MAAVKVFPLKVAYTNSQKERMGGNDTIPGREVFVRQSVLVIEKASIVLTGNALKYFHSITSHLLVNYGRRVRGRPFGKGDQ